MSSSDLSFQFGLQSDWLENLVLTIVIKTTLWAVKEYEHPVKLLENMFVQYEIEYRSNENTHISQVL